MLHRFITNWKRFKIVIPRLEIIGHEFVVNIVVALKIEQYNVISLWQMSQCLVRFYPLSGMFRRKISVLYETISYLKIFSNSNQSLSYRMILLPELQNDWQRYNNCVNGKSKNLTIFLAEEVLVTFVYFWNILSIRYSAVCS